MKLSELMELYDFDLFKDTNGNFYMHDNSELMNGFEGYKSVGNEVLNVVDTIPDGLIYGEIYDIQDGYISKELVNKCFDKGYNLDDIESAIAFLEYAKTVSDEEIDSKLDLLKAIYNCDFEDDYKEGFITEDIFKAYPKFGFAFDYIGQGYGYKANYNCKWEEIPETAIMYISEYAIRTDEETGIEFATSVYTKKDLENLIEQYKMTDDHFITAEGLLDALTWEYPETYLEGCDFDFDIDIEEKVEVEEFEVLEDTSIDSMNYSSGTTVAYMKFSDGITCEIRVTGEVSVTYKDKTYHDYKDFPDELKELVRNEKIFGGDIEDLCINMNNWYEIYYDDNYNYIDSVPIDLDSYSKKDIFEEFIKWRKDADKYYYNKVTEITYKNEDVSKITKEPKETKNKNTKQKEK